MHLKPAAPILGVVAVAALAVATYQFVWAPNVGGPSIVPRTFTAEDLPTILLSDENAPAGFTVDEQGRETGGSALVMPLRPGGDAFDMTAFVDALSVTGGDDVGGYMTWAALFETPEAAGEAFDLVATEHDSPDGWGLASTRTDPGLGDESATWTGQQYDLVPSARTIFWCVGNLLLAVVGFADWNAGDVRGLADAMADRAESYLHGPLAVPAPPGVGSSSILPPTSSATLGWLISRFRPWTPLTALPASPRTPRGRTAWAERARPARSAVRAPAADATRAAAVQTMIGSARSSGSARTCSTTRSPKSVSSGRSRSTTSASARVSRTVWRSGFR